MPPSAPYREIRAQYDVDTITVYQAYKVSIAEAAVNAQKLNASSDFRPGRMTWIKPSWAWMMYRSGYSYKDPGQARILAIKMKREAFLDLLDQGVLSSHSSTARGPALSGSKRDVERLTKVRIQWDPERTPTLEVLPYRSIQIGIPAALSNTWADNWVVSIEDVTETARDLKKVIDEEPDITTEELLNRGLVPTESVFPVTPSIRERLGMGIVKP